MDLCNLNHKWQQEYAHRYSERVGDLSQLFTASFSYFAVLIITFLTLQGYSKKSWFIINLRYLKIQVKIPKYTCFSSTDFKYQSKRKFKTFFP